MFGALKHTIIREVFRVTDRITRDIKRHMFLFFLEFLFLMLGIVFISAGLLFLGARYLGWESMLIAGGIFFILIYMGIKLTRRTA